MMRQKSLPVLLTAVLLAAGVSACGKDNTSDTDTGLEISPTEDAGTDAGKPQNTSQSEDTDDDTESTKPDTDVTSDLSDTKEPHASENPVTVTFEKTIDEVKGDDGTVIFTNSVQMPVVQIDGAEDIAEKINADLREYYAAFSIDNIETADIAKEDYASSLGEDGWDFIGYSTDVSVNVTRSDENVVSFQITVYDFTGGAHGNYGSGGRNYSAKTGELLSINEIAGDYNAFHATVLDYMINLAETPAYEDKLFGPPSKNDLDSVLFDGNNWVFTKSGISFLVAPYVLGPYASGEISFRLPYEKAYDLGLKEDYHYNGNFVDERYYIYKYDPETFEPVVDGDPDFYFDLNGDGAEEGLALYGQVVDPATGESGYAFYIDGKDFGEVIAGQIGDAAKNGYMDNSYALYDSDPADGLTEIAVLFTQFAESSSESGSTDSLPYTYLFRYTPEKELQFLEKRDGFVTLPTQP